MSGDAKQTTTSNSSHFTRRVLSPTLFLLAIAMLVIIYGQRVVDHYMAARFVPSTSVATVNEQLNLTGLGHDLLYASNPSVETGQQFNQHCETTERSAAILGCYYKRTIYLYDVTNPELAGAEEVTAAHEMLHAAYERLQIWEKNNVNALLEAEYAKIKNQPDIKKLMEYYSTNEPGEIDNELHSIIGTTVASISPELEQYYSQYFNDRAAIVAMNTKYNTLFATVEAQSTEIAAKIDSEGPVLQRDLSSYEAERTVLTNDIQTFNQRAKGDYYTSTSAIESARQALLARSSALEAERVSLNSRVDAYNALIKQYNDLSVRVNQLNSSINGVSAPTPGV